MPASMEACHAVSTVLASNANRRRHTRHFLYSRGRLDSCSLRGSIQMGELTDAPSAKSTPTNGALIRGAPDRMDESQQKPHRISLAVSRPSKNGRVMCRSSGGGGWWLM